MITIESPSMAINDSRAAVSYTMDVTRTVQPSTSMSAIVALIVSAAGNAQGGTIRNLILTAHGLPASFQLGTGLNSSTMSPFSGVNGKVSKIWFRGCLVGRIIGTDTATQGDGAALQAIGVTSGNGHQFLSSFARLTGAYVVAPTEMQASRLTSYSQGVMDSYEGLVLSYDPQGNVSWQRRYPSLYGYSQDATRASLPNRE